MNRLLLVALVLASLCMVAAAQQSGRKLNNVITKMTAVDPDSSPYQRLVAKVALAIENKVKWTKDPALDGAQAKQMFQKEFAKINQETAPVDTEDGKDVFDPNWFRENVRNLVSLDVSPYSATKQPDEWRPYSDTFITVFDVSGLP